MKNSTRMEDFDSAPVELFWGFARKGKHSGGIMDSFFREMRLLKNLTPCFGI